MSRSVGIAFDDGGYALKMELVHSMRGWGFEVNGCGAEHAPKRYPLPQLGPLSGGAVSRSGLRSSFPHTPFDLDS